MATLLHKILKELVRKAGRHLTSPFQIAKPAGGFGASIRRAGQLEEGFQAFVDNFFIAEPSTNAGAVSSERRPATALGGKGDRSMGSARKKDASSELGWWRATVRTSLEHADHCRRVAERVKGLMEKARWLAGALTSLRSLDPELLQKAEGFLEIYGGMKGAGDMDALLDPKRRLEVDGQLQEVEERLQNLISKAEALGAHSEELPDSYALEVPSHADILILPETEEQSDQVAPLKPPPHTCGELQDDIANMREELRQFGSQLENLSSVARQKARRPLTFAPMARVGEQASAQEAAAPQEDEEEGYSWKVVDGKVQPAEADDVETDQETAEKTAAREVAKRSSWYKAPPSPLPEDCEVISVRSQIELRPITDASSRPTTGHPCLFAGGPSSPSTSSGSRPFTAPALAGGRPATSCSFREAFVAQRLGYDFLAQPSSPSAFSPSRAAVAASSSSASGSASIFVTAAEGVDGSAEQDEDEIEDEWKRWKGNGDPEEVAEDNEPETRDEIPEPPIFDEASPSDSEVQVLELPDLDDDPFCDAAVSWNVS